MKSGGDEGLIMILASDVVCLIQASDNVQLHYLQGMVNLLTEQGWL